jgi:hypothetical protein
MLKESLESSIVGLDLGTAWKCRGNLGEIDGFDFEQANNEIGEAFDAGEMPVRKVEFQDIGEYGSLRHGIVPSYVGDCDTVFIRTPTIGNYSLFSNTLESFVAYSERSEAYG